jgi:hypothetical protein
MNEKIKQINWKIFEKFQERDDRTNSTYQRLIKGLKNGIKEIKHKKCNFDQEKDITVSLNLSRCFAVLLITSAASRASSGT